MHEVLSKLETATIGAPDTSDPLPAETNTTTTPPAAAKPHQEGGGGISSGSGSQKKAKKSKKNKSDKSGGHHHKSRKRSKDKDKSIGGGGAVSGETSLKKVSLDKSESAADRSGHDEVVTAGISPPKSVPTKAGEEKKKSSEGDPVKETEQSQVTFAVAKADDVGESVEKQTPAKKPVAVSTPAAAEAVVTAPSQPDQQEGLVADAVISLNPETYDILDEEIDQEIKLERTKKKEPPEDAAKRRSAPTKRTRTRSYTSPSKTRTSPGVASSKQATPTKRSVSTGGSYSHMAEVTNKRTVERTSTKTTGRMRSSSAGNAQSTVTVVRIKARVF